MEDIANEAHEMNEKMAEQAGHRWDPEKRAWVKEDDRPSVRPETSKTRRDDDIVTEASKESFPASDSPGFNG